MIIELFGPPGSGKTTFAHALARRLREEGCRTKVALSYQPSDRAGSFDFGIFLFIVRIASALFSTFKILLSSRGRAKDLSISLSMVKIIPPKRKIWRARLWQYILKLSRCWDQAKKSREVVIFDQGYIQAIGSLAMFNGGADNVALAKALSLAPKADFTIRVMVPRAIVETRLRQRMKLEPPAERIFEADFDVNMRSFGVFQSINDLLVGSGRKIFSIETLNSQTASKSVRYIEQKVISKILQGDEPVVRGGRGHEMLHSGASDIGDCPDTKSESISATALVSRILPTNGKASADAVLPQQENKGRSLAHASIFALAIYVGGAGLTSLAQLLIARLIGSTSYGIYSYVLAWTSVLAYLATLGFNVSLLRFVPAYRANGQLGLARGVIKFALQRSLAAATLFAATGAVLIFFFSDPSQKELQISNLIGMAAVPLVTAYAIGATLVRAFGGVVSALLPERIVRDGLLLMLLGIAAMSGSWTLDAPLVMQAVLASSGITVALVFITASRLQPPGLRQAETGNASRQWWSAAPPIMLITGLEVFITRAGVMVLGWTDHIRDAGIFALGLNVALLVGLSRLAVSTMFSPTAAALHAKGDRKALQQLFSRATVLSFAGAVAMAIPLLVIVEPLLSWFGEDFIAGAPIARVLIVGFVFVAMCGPQMNLLTMTGNEWAAAATMVAGAIVNVTACAAGVALYGPLGAAMGVALALAVWNVAMAIYIGKRLKIMPGLIVALLSLRPGAVEGQQRYWFLH